MRLCVISKWTWPICFCVDMYEKEVDGGRLILCSLSMNWHRGWAGCFISNGRGRFCFCFVLIFTGGVLLMELVMGHGAD